MKIKNPITYFYDELRDRIANYGGIHNAHLHLDRAGTLDERYMEEIGHRILESSHISLSKKHSLIATLHAGPAYEQEDLQLRINSCLDIMVACNTRRADTLVDVTADRVGLSALRLMQEIKTARKSDIELRIGAYTPLGFLDGEPERWDLFVEGAKEADFVAALPEADDKDDYPDHIGFEEHCQRVLSVAQDKQCMIHVHTDQRNEPGERGTERLIEFLDRKGSYQPQTGEPLIWAVHMISPSTYDDSRFESLVKGLLRHNIGVICCPSAAIGMRQLRPMMTPTYNSIPRVLELLAEGVEVRLASDNIADICSPSTTANLIDEIFVLSAAVRFYHIDILAKLATGCSLSDQDRDHIHDHLEKNRWETQKAINGSRTKTDIRG